MVNTMNVEKVRFLREKLRILERESGGVFEEQEGCCGLTTAQCHTLLETGNRGPVSLVDLAQFLGLDTSTLSVQSIVAPGATVWPAWEDSSVNVTVGSAVATADNVSITSVASSVRRILETPAQSAAPSSRRARILCAFFTVPMASCPVNDELPAR